MMLEKTPPVDSFDEAEKARGELNALDSILRAIMPIVPEEDRPLFLLPQKLNAVEKLLHDLLGRCTEMSKSPEGEKKGFTDEARDFAAASCDLLDKIKSDLESFYADHPFPETSNNA